MLTLTNPLSIEGYTVYRDDANDIAAFDAGVDARMRADHDHVASLDPANTSSTGHPTGTPAAAPPATSAGAGAQRFWVLPKDPTLSVDANGKPLFSLIVYRRDDARIDPTKVPTADVGGGILTFTVELSVPDADVRRVASRLRALVYGSDDSDASHDVTVSVVEFISGSVSVAVAGEGTADTAADHEFVRTAVGTGKVSGVGGNRKAVMVKLTQDGAALMSSLAKLRTLPINVAYDMTFEHRLLGVRMKVWCDVTSSYHLIQEHQSEKTGEDNSYFTGSHDIMTEKVKSVTEVMTRNKTAGVEVIPESSAVDNDTLLAMEKFGEDMLSKAMEKAIESAPPPDKLDRAYLDKYFSDANDSLNFELDRRMVLQRGYNPSTNLANVLNRGDLDQMVTFVDLRVAFFALLKVPIRVNADFARLPISSVTVTVEYKSRNLDGSPRARIESFNFTDGSTVQTFLAYADSLDEVAYDYTAAVHYKDSEEPFVVRRSGVKDTFLVVDVGTLGVISVDIGLGLYDPDHFPEAEVTVRYTTRASGHGAEQTFTLGREHPSVVWNDVIREESTNAYEYKVDWLRKDDNAILPGTWQPSNSLRMRVDAPVPDHLTVSVVASGNFKDPPNPLSHVVVSLRYRDDANHYAVDKQLDFTDDKQMQSWTVDLRNSGLRDYQYRYDEVYKDGLVKHVPPDGTSWLPGQPGFVVVGEKYTIEVNVYPYLLTFDDHARVVQVDLHYEDPDHNITCAGSFVFSKENTATRTWRCAGDPTGPRTWTADVTYFAVNGTQTKLPTRSSDTDTLVVPPPASPSPTTH